jgi:transposase
MKQFTTQTCVPTAARAVKTSVAKKSSKRASSPPPVSSPTSNTIGLDLGDRCSHFCVLDAGGRALEQGRVAMSPAELTAFFERVGPARLVLEVGRHSPWVSRLAQAAGMEVIVANPRRVQLITRNERKNDRTDAELLARLGRVDAQLLSPVTHRSVEHQADLAVKRARDAAAASRTALINHVRGAVKSFGLRLPTCSPDSFHRRVLAHLPEELAPALEPIVRLIGQATDEIKNFDAQIEALADERYPVTKVLRQVSGVGPVTALSFVLTLDTPDRVSDSRQVGPYLGLVPRTHDSGASSPQLRDTQGRRSRATATARDRRELHPRSVRPGLRSATLRAEACGAGRQEWTQASQSRGRAQAGRAPASLMEDGRGVRALSIWPRSAVSSRRPDPHTLSSRRILLSNNSNHVSVPPCSPPVRVTARSSLCLEHAR